MSFVVLSGYLTGIIATVGVDGHDDEDLTQSLRARLSYWTYFEIYVFGHVVQVLPVPHLVRLKSRKLFAHTTKVLGTAVDESQSIVDS